MTTNHFPERFLAALQRHGGAAGLSHDTVGATICAVAHERKLDRLPDSSIRSTYGWPGARILDRLAPGAKVADLDFDTVRTLAQSLRDDGLSARTVRDKDLALVRMCRAHHGLENVVRPVTRRLRRLLALDPEDIEVFSAEEVSELSRRIMEFEGERALPARRAHVAILRFMWLRAIRCEEFGRVRIVDFDHHRATLSVLQAKSPTTPRIIPLCTQLLDDARVLIGQRAKGLLVAGGARAIRNAAYIWAKRLEEPRLQCVVLRQSAATILAEQGATQAEIGEFLGHSRGSRHTARYCIARRQRMDAHRRALDYQILGERVDPDSIAAALPRMVS